MAHGWSFQARQHEHYPPSQPAQLASDVGLTSRQTTLTISFYPFPVDSKRPFDEGHARACPFPPDRFPLWRTVRHPCDALPPYQCLPLSSEFPLPRWLFSPELFSPFFFLLFAEAQQTSTSSTLYQRSLSPVPVWCVVLNSATRLDVLQLGFLPFSFY